MALSINAGAFRPFVRTTAFSSASSQTVQPTASVEQRVRTLANERFGKRALALRENLVVLQDAIAGIKTNSKAKAASVVSSAEIGLIAVQSRASLTSSGELNTRTTAFTPTDPVFQSGSQSDPLISGVYNGDQGSGTLTFTVTQGGLRQLSNTRIRVDDPSGGLIEELTISAADPSDTRYALSNGLELALGNGTLLPGDRFTVDVQSGLDLKIDPDAAFDGSDGDPAFDAGEAVQAGSFEVNGTLIDVFATDSVNDVLSRISSSAAGVVASYDSETETVELQQQTPGASSTVAVANDTSGFLAAVKLDDGLLTPGQDSELDLPLAEVSAFAGVSAGNLLINGVSIALDPSTESLQAIVDKINQADAGVVASLIRDQRLSLRSENDADGLTLSGNGTGFFAALNLAGGTYEPRPGDNRPSRGSVNRTTDALRDVAASFNRLFATPIQGIDPGVVNGLRARSEAAFQEALKAADLDPRKLGLSLDATAEATEITFDRGNSSRFRRQLTVDFSTVREVFLGTKKPDTAGLVDRLIASVNQSLNAVGFSNRAGVLIDTSA